MELNYVFGTAAIMLGVFTIQVVTRRFDPFAPIWLFLVGYLQVYVVQAISYHDWAVNVRGEELVGLANQRALWSLVLFVFVYYSGLGRLFAPLLPRPPARWSTSTINLISPAFIIWGLVCSGVLLRSEDSSAADLSPEAALLRSFPFLMLVAANLLIVTGASAGSNRPTYLWMGVAVAAAYVFIWMFNGKRSHSLIGVLSAACAYFIARRKRPSWPVLISMACAGVFVVGVAIGWRNYKEKGDRPSFSTFLQFIGDFQLSSLMESLNIEEDDGVPVKFVTHETVEYGGFLLMMDTVPEKSGFDYGANYLRVFSTFIPRFVWRDKPLFGREQWVSAWIAGSELKRDATFTGPAIGLLGATQLNGGAWGTAIVITFLALLLRTSYEYFLRYSTVPWVLAWWSISYYNAWFMVVCDDPLIWFYYNWGFTCLPTLILLWIVNQFAPSSASVPESGVTVQRPSGQWA
ncbi:MAG: hypothetical protein JO116_01125 [Planctomycetaceae bacterium]|nr:hypothetical protein [Planctomycetaceae bacterium]